MEQEKKELVYQNTVMKQRWLLYGATGALIGTPAFISAIVEPHTEAIDEEPFDEVISFTTLIA